MRTLRTLVILARSLVILTIGMAGAAVAETLLTQTWTNEITTSRVCCIIRSTP
jgi:hypothetical protein